MNSILQKLHEKLQWPKENDIFDPPGAGPAVYTRLARLKIQNPLERRLGVDQVKVGILSGDPANPNSDTPIALVCSFNQALSIKDLNETRRLAWNFCRSPLLITIEPQLVRAWSCYEQPDDQSGHFPPEPVVDNILESINLDPLAQTLHWIYLASGQFFTKHQERFNRNQRADILLLENLRYVREQLTTKLPKNIALPDDIAHDLLARIIFVQFLMHRKDSQGKAALDEKKLMSLKVEGILSRSHKDLRSLLQHKTDTFSLFQWLNKKFNGDLFPRTYTREKEWVKPSHLKLLADLVSGDLVMADGQHLIWPYYSFDTIPLEFISSIYEEFVTKRKDEEGIGEHYTRPFLVDFILDKVLPWDSKVYDLKILDPCCGSAVFLVKAFQRLVHRWRNAHPGKEPRAEDLRYILENNLFGVDNAPNAIHVASFSLYLAMCDEIDPKNYWSRVRFPSLRDSRLLNADFFQEDIAEINTEIEENDKYDLIIGNAPWGEDSLTTDAKLWAQKNKWPTVDEQAGTLFLAKAAKLCREDGRICMIQSASSLIFNINSTALAFRKKIFTEYQVDEIVNLSALRHLKIFPNAIGPACIITLRAFPPNEQPIAFWSPKQTNTDEEQHRVVIDELDLNWVWPEEAASDPIVWPALFWGGQRDLAFLKKIMATSSTVRNAEENKTLSTARGFQRGIKDLKQRDARINLPVLQDSDIWNDCPTITNTKYFPQNNNPLFEKPREDKIFTTPLIVLKESWTTTSGNRFKAVLVKKSPSNNMLLYSNSFIGIQSDNYDMLASVTTGINSSFSVYFLFLTSGRLASYRPTIRNEDIKNLPIPKKLLSYDKLSNLPDKDIDKNTFDMYELNDVERTLIKEFCEITLHDYKDPKHSVGHQGVWNTSNCRSRTLEIYCEWFVKVLKSGFGKDKQVSATLFKFDSPTKLPYCLVAIHLDFLPKEPIRYEHLTDKDLLNKLSELDEHFQKQEGGAIYYRKVSRIYHTIEITDRGKKRKVPTVFLIKPNQIRYWTKSVALRDADEVAFDLLQWSKRDDNRVGVSVNA